MGGLGAHSNQNPAQSIQHFMLPSPLVSASSRTQCTEPCTLFLHLHLHLSCPARLAYRGPNCPSLFLHTDQIHGQAQGRCHARARPRTSILLVESLLQASTTLSYPALIAQVDDVDRTF